ncbi:MAG TPA: hypothetical protein VHT34_13290, partial [Clostridia bacterium]|nr:hypothetical protein [Clostridia bacterium]
MFRHRFAMLILIFSFVISVLFAAFPANTTIGKVDLFSDIKGKVAGISEKEKATLQKLFTQAQTIQETEKKAEEAADDVHKAQLQVDDIRKLIEKDEAAYEKERGSLKQVLQCYQRMGPGSYLEIVLESDDLPDLLMRINILRDLTHNTGELMDRIKQDREKQAKEKVKLSVKLQAVQIKQQRLEQTLQKEYKLKADLQKVLASLADQKGYYQNNLSELQQAWSEVKPFFE